MFFNIITEALEVVGRYFIDYARLSLINKFGYIISNIVFSKFCQNSACINISLFRVLCSCISDLKVKLKLLKYSGKEWLQ